MSVAYSRLFQGVSLISKREIEWVFSGGVFNQEKGRLGGVQGLCTDPDLETRLMLEMGQQPDLWNDYYGFPYRPKSFNFLEISRALKLYPVLQEAMRQDYLVRMGIKPPKTTDLEMLGTHFHFDHMGGVTLLRPDLKIHMHQDAMLVAYVWQQLSGRNINQFVDFIDQFTLTSKREGDEKFLQGPKAVIGRNFHTFGDYESFKVGNMNVTAYPVDHSLPGSCAFILETSAGLVAISGDLRVRGRHRHLTEKFVKALSELHVKYLFWEGSLMHFDHEGTEDDLAVKVAELINTRKFAAYSAPPRDFDRLTSLYKAAKATGRILCIFPDQMLYLKAFNGRNGYPKIDDPNIAVIMPKKGKGVLDQEGIPENLIEGDYKYWERQFIDWKQWSGCGHEKDGPQLRLVPDDERCGAPVDGRQRVTLEDIAKYPEKFFVSMPFAYMIDMLTVIQPPRNSEDSIYIRSHPAPWTKDMETSEDRQVKILEQFGILDAPSADHMTPGRGIYRIHTVHVTGHNNKRENAEIFDSLPMDIEIIAYHCMYPQIHKELAKGRKVIIPNLNEPFRLAA